MMVVVKMAAYPQPLGLYSAYLVCVCRACVVQLKSSKNRIEIALGYFRSDTNLADDHALASHTREGGRYRD